MFKPHKTVTSEVWLCATARPRCHPMYNPIQHTHLQQQPHTHVQCWDCRLKLTGTAQRQHMLAVLIPSAPYVFAAFYLYQVDLHHRGRAQRQQVCCQRYLQGRTKVTSSNFCWCESLNSQSCHPPVIFYEKHKGCSFKLLLTTNVSKSHKPGTAEPTTATPFSV